MLQALSTSAALDRGDLVAFRAAALRVKELDRAWANIVLHDRTGRQLMNLLRPPGAPLPATPMWPDQFTQALHAQQPLVGPLVSRGPIIQEPVFTIDAPVMRNEKLVYVLAGIVRPAALLPLIGKQAVPNEGVVSILDARSNHVARSRAHTEWLGRPASDALQRLMARGSEGWGPSMTLEGQATYAAFSRSPVTGWTVAVGIPRTAIDGPLMRSWATLAGSVVLSLALGLAAALMAARSVSGPVQGLRDAAQALGRGTAPVVLPTALPEIREVGEALTAAHTERERLLEAERRARSEAETASRIKDEFLAMLSHELRNPLNVIAGGVSTLNLIGRGDEPAARTRALIQRQVQHLTDLMDDLLDVTRVTTGKIILHRRPIDLGAAVARCVAMHLDTGRLGRHQVNETIMPVWVEADETRVEQIVANLIGNALKYTPTGGEINVTVRAVGEDAELRVEDNGAGIAPELLPRVFDLFVQGDQTVERSRGGLGLGLTLVRRLTELQGGTVTAASDGVGRGAMFIVRLPRITAPAASTEGRAPTATPAPTRPVLVVEDNADGREMLRMMLTRHGHEVYDAADGPSAIATALEIQPDVAIIDIGLPGMDGYTVAARLRQDGRTKRTRLIALTGYGSEEDRRRTGDAGFDAHMIKPVDPARLVRLLAETSMS